MATPYEDKLDDVMRYVTMRLNDRGFRLNVSSKEDIARSIKALDKDRKPGEDGSRGAPKITDGFIQKVLSTGRADDYVGKTLGSRGPKRTLAAKRPTFDPTQDAVLAPRIKRLKRQGKDVFPSKGGEFASKTMFKNRAGKVQVSFRDVRTGRFVRKDLFD